MEKIRTISNISDKITLILKKKDKNNFHDILLHHTNYTNSSFNKL